MDPSPISNSSQPPSPTGGVAMVLTGGGARAAYQVGLLRAIARQLPEVEIPYITGVSAGAINAAEIAAHTGGFGAAAEELTEMWRHLTTGDVFRAGPVSMTGNLLRWVFRTVTGSAGSAAHFRSFLDTSPLRRLLSRSVEVRNGELVGIRENLAAGRLKAFALSTLNYSTGQTVTWVEGSNIQGWDRPSRVGINTRLTVEHIMASAALPMLFPAVQLNDHWFGDGGVRLASPLAPAVHLGADRILAISTRYARSRAEADEPVSVGYPPPAQVLGTLMNSVFLDLIDHDALRLERTNRLLEQLPGKRSGALRPIRLLVIRPSIDLGKLAANYEFKLPRFFRFATRGLGTRETKSPDFLSLLMFQPDYLQRLIELGEHDAEERMGEIVDLLTAATESS